MQTRSVVLFAASAALAIVATASLAYTRKVQRDFAAPTAVTTGVAHSRGAPLGRRRSHTQSFCWVSYEFTAPDGRKRWNWRFWEPACGTFPSGTLPIRYVVANPDVNRPDGSDPWDPSWLFFFASGVTMVIAFIFWRSGQDDRADWQTVLHG